MSAETSASTSSFFTRLFETNSRANGDDLVSDEHASHPAFIADNKRYKKYAVIAAVGTAAVIAVSWKTLSKFAPVEEEVTEETISND